MLKKSLRLRSREDFERIFKRGKALFSSEIALFFRSDPGLSGPRVGIAFKQKAFPRATERHFLKRKANAAMAVLLKKFPAPGDMVILFHKRGSLAMTYQSVLQVLENLLEKRNKEKK